jgi:hypothetical protein
MVFKIRWLKYLSLWGNTSFNIKEMNNYQNLLLISVDEVQRLFNIKLNVIKNEKEIDSLFKIYNQHSFFRTLLNSVISNSKASLM